MKKFLILFIIVFSLINKSFPQSSNTLSLKEIKRGWILLFDGKSTSGWTTTRNQPVPADGGGWTIDNGCINTVLQGKGGDIITRDEYSDFDLKVDFKITPGCNSGIK